MTYPLRGVRAERSEDFEAIARVNEAAFGRPDEANLVTELRHSTSHHVSLVAELTDGRVVGHIFFSPVTILGHEGLNAMALAPMTVDPVHQRTGIGTALVEHGLAACQAVGAGAVIVLGHHTYYPRFGFSPASRFGLSSPYEVPNEAFMAIELTAGYLNGVEGTVKFHAAFDGL